MADRTCARFFSLPTHNESLISNAQGNVILVEKSHPLYYCLQLYSWLFGNKVIKAPKFSEYRHVIEVEMETPLVSFTLLLMEAHDLAESKTTNLSLLTNRRF
jgi:hypothetical protein